MDLVKFLLEEAGWEVLSAFEAQAAREILDQRIPDIILLDIQLPGCDGLDLVREFRARPSMAELPVIALTAHAMRGDKERFLASGFTGYISKPIQVATFVKEVEAFLGREPGPE
jgi:two-component system cell cycle response regulator DivK